MHRVENISEKFISYLQKTFDKINPNHIRCIVSEADMNENFLISGSAVLGFCMELLDSKISFKPRDLDIFIDYQKHQDIKFYIHRFSTLLKQEFQKTNKMDCFSGLTVINYNNNSNSNIPQNKTEITGNKESK